jgi:hypothetical protein
MVQSKLLLVFGDQTFDIPSALQELISHRQKSKFLHMFLNEISNTLQQEVATIPLHEKSWFPGHANIDTLADQYSRNARQCTAPQMFLTTVVQLGNLILSVFKLSPELFTNTNSDL